METTTNPKENGALSWADSAPAHVSEIVGLYSWASNYQDMAPFRKFLDLIGYSVENYGSPLADWSNPADSLGFVEIGYLADALQQYANRPLDCEGFIEELLSVEGEFGL